MEQALEQLLLAFAKADVERGDGRTDKVEWADLEIALEMAREALPGRYLEIVRELKAQDEEDAEDVTRNFALTHDQRNVLCDIAAHALESELVNNAKLCDGERSAIQALYDLFWLTDAERQQTPKPIEELPDIRVDVFEADGTTVVQQNVWLRDVLGPKRCETYRVYRGIMKVRGMVWVRSGTDQRQQVKPATALVCSWETNGPEPSYCTACSASWTAHHPHRPIECKHPL